MASSMLVACAKCESLPTSITFFSTDDFAHTAAANLCASCAGQVAFNRCNLQRLVKQGWKVGSTRLRKRPRRLVIDPRWKEKPTLAHECVRFIMRNMDLISAKQVVQALPEHLQQAMLTQFIKSSSKLSPGCANVLRAVAFRPTAAIVLKDCSLNDFDMQFVAYFATQDAPCTSTMDVSWNRIGQRGASAMSNTLRQVQYLHNVDLSWTLFGDEGFKLLSSGIASNRSVVQLNLAGTRISERSGSLLSHILRVNTTLQDLNLGFNNLRRIGASEMQPGLEVNRTLTRLNVRSNKLGREGAVSLAKALRGNIVLTQLVIADNNIGELGAMALASMTAIKTVELVRGVMPNFDEVQAERRRRAQAVLTEQAIAALQASLAMGADGGREGNAASDSDIDSEGKHTTTPAHERGSGHGIAGSDPDHVRHSEGEGTTRPQRRAGVPELMLGDAQAIDDAARKLALARAVSGRGGRSTKSARKKPL